MQQDENSSETERGTWRSKALLYGASALVALSTLTGCRGYQTEVGTAIGTATGAATGALLAGDDDRLTGALIGAAAGGGTGYLIGSNLETQDQRELMQSYNRLIRMQDREAVLREIDLIGDRVLGDGDGYTSAAERSEAMTQLGYALDTAADQAPTGNRDGNTDPMERRRYIHNHEDRPLVQFLTRDP